MTHKKADDKGADYVLVYSTDPIPRPAPQPAPAKSPLPPDKINPAVRIERKGRGGKTVTLLSKLPAADGLLSDLCSFLKKSLGTGGTFYTENGQGIIEIQGERIDDARRALQKYKSK